MFEILVNGKLACICLPELVNLIMQVLVPNIGLEYKVEVRKHEEQKKDAE